MRRCRLQGRPGSAARESRAQEQRHLPRIHLLPPIANHGQVSVSVCVVLGIGIREVLPAVPALFCPVVEQRNE